MNGSVPDPESIGFMAKMVAALVALGSLFGTWFGMHKYTHAKIDKKANIDTLNSLDKYVRENTVTKEVFQQHSDQDDKMLRDLTKEIGTQRGHVTDIFKQMREMEKIGTDRHIELLNAIHANGKKR